MGKLLNIITPLHKCTARDYLKRMLDHKVDCMRVARHYGQDFWDGDRRFGYGGYQYDGRWEKVAKQLIAYYGLLPDATILDVGCGKGYLLYEIQKILPQARGFGFDRSTYAMAQAPQTIRPHLFYGDAGALFPFKDKTFDLVLSLTTLHNLPVHRLQSSLKEIERVGQNQYIVTESYRNEKELFNLQCWALTCESFFSTEEWVWLFKTFGFYGDYEFIYFE